MGDRPQKIYLSGLISGGGRLPPPAEVEANRERFHSEAGRLRALGFEVLSPIEIQGDPSWTWQQWMREAPAMLLGADAVVMLPGWDKSRGARIERWLALALDIPLGVPGAA